MKEDRTQNIDNCPYNLSKMYFSFRLNKRLSYAFNFNVQLPGIVKTDFQKRFTYSMRKVKSKQISRI